MKFAIAASLLALASTQAQAQVNAGNLKSDADLPFKLTQVQTFDLPWRLAFLPDGRMLVTEKVGPIWLVTQQGAKLPVANVPAVAYGGQGGMLGVFLSPHYASDHNVYLTYSEPGDYGSGLALARAKLSLSDKGASLDGLQGAVARCAQRQGRTVRRPDRLFARRAISVPGGGRAPAHDAGAGPQHRAGQDFAPDAWTESPRRAIRWRASWAPSTRPLIDPPRDTEAAKTAPIVSTYKMTGPNLAPSEIWSSGHRTPYGLAFSPDGRLWEAEHGPRGGDELNLIEPGKNYGWPLVSYATNYNGVPIPSPDSRNDLAKPVIYWTPIIAPGNLIFYKGAMFPQWNGSALMGGMDTETLNRITFDGKGGAKPAERWDVGHRDPRRRSRPRRRAVDAGRRPVRRVVQGDGEITAGRPRFPFAMLLFKQKGACMKSLIVLTGVLLSMAAPLAHAGDAAVEATIRQFADAFNKGDMAAAAALHIARPTITDEVPPYFWSGAKAFESWGADLGKSEAAEGKSGGRVSIGAPTRENTVGGRAYVVAPTTYTFQQKGRTMRETAQITIVLDKQAAGWKIASWTWTGPEATPVP